MRGAAGGNKAGLLRILLRIQMTVGAFFVVLGMAFPFIVIYMHGTGSAVVYDRFGNAIGTANYLLLSVGLGLACIAMGSIAIMMARRSLRSL